MERRKCVRDAAVQPVLHVVVAGPGPRTGRRVRPTRLLAALAGDEIEKLIDYRRPFRRKMQVGDERGERHVDRLESISTGRRAPATSIGRSDFFRLFDHDIVHRHVLVHAA